MSTEITCEIVSQAKAMLVRKIEEAGAKEEFDAWRKLEAMEREAANLEREIAILKRETAVRKKLNSVVQEDLVACMILESLVAEEMDDDTSLILH